MVKLFRVYFPRITLRLILIESALLVGALIGTALVHFGNASLTALTTEFGLLKIALAAIVCLFFLYYSNLYAPTNVRNPRAVPARFLEALGIAAVVLAVAYYLLPALQLYPGFIITSTTLATALLLSNRKVFTSAKRASKEERVVVLGDGALAKLISRVIQERPELGFRLMGYLGNSGTAEPWKNSLNHLGGSHDLTDVARNVKPARIIVAMGDQRGRLPVAELLELKTSGTVIQDGADFYEILTGKLPISAIRLSWLIFSPGFKASKMTLVYKRMISVVLALFGLLILLPLIGLIATAIRLDSPGPIIFRQKRIGLRGELFTLFKFRTMLINADRGGYARPAEHNDVRITRVGRWLRRFRLDEIPQLYNILIGEMYFVGPRPFVSEQELECASQIPLYSYRWSVRPGATGWAQVKRGYCASLEDNIDKLSYDLFYIKNMSIGLDLLIIFKTIKIVLSAQGGR